MLRIEITVSTAMQTEQRPQPEVQRPEAREGERYIGGVIEPDGRTRHVFLIAGEVRRNWEAGLEWAQRRGGDLPDRIEYSLLNTFMLEEFKIGAYWSNTPHADNSHYAWYQIFGAGYQNSDLKSTEYRVRAVRRVYVEPKGGN